MLLFLYTALALCIASESLGQSATEAVEIARYKNEFSTARIEPAGMDDKSGIAVIFEGTHDLHYYARSETAPAVGNQLQIKVESDTFIFDEPVFPEWETIKEPLTKRSIEVYAGNFKIFIPFNTDQSPITKANADVIISGQACTSNICLFPFQTTISTAIDLSRSADWHKITFEKASEKTLPAKAPLGYSMWYALALAFVAGVLLNIMPCVWPVLPLVVFRIVEQAKKNKGKKIMMGIAFCLGMVLFFASLAIANIILQLTVGTALQWGDQFRNPVFVTVMALVLVVLAMFMFDAFTIIVPASVSGKSGSASGYPGTVGMGFLAAVLSTPCSFGILAAVIAWAQSQPLTRATAAILVIGLGMGTPYVVLTAIPGLLEKLPKPGAWMEIFKKFVGFVLLAVAVWMITVIPAERRISVLYYALVVALCLWMWGGWVSFSSKLSNKVIVRGLAIALAVAGGFYLLKPPVELADWQKYNGKINKEEKEKGQPVLIKFTADWCMSCKYVDKIVYSRKDIAELIKQKGVLAVKADTTVKDTPATWALQNVYNEAVPFTVLHLPDGREKHWLGKGFGNELKKLLQEIERNE